MQANAQKYYKHYNVDSLLQQLSVNKQVNRILKNAAIIYQHAGISKQDISPDAFKIAYLEKTFLDSSLIHVQLPKDSTTLPYRDRNILTVVDYTRKGNRRRFITVDLTKQKILHQTLVSHGSGLGKGSDELVHKYGISREQINNRNEVPVFFGNTDTSYRSSLGLVLAIKGDKPDNLCHLCKYFLSQPHHCVVILGGLEKDINDNDIAREIVVHTTGSKDFSDSISSHKIASVLNILVDSLDGLKKRNCGCLLNNNMQSSYASLCGIKENKGFIGRSAGCFVLPEETHAPIMQTIENGSLLFAYSNVMAPTSTNYFSGSPIIREIVLYVKLHPF